MLSFQNVSSFLTLKVIHTYYKIKKIKVLKRKVAIVEFQHTGKSAVNLSIFSTFSFIDMYTSLFWGTVME